MGEIAIVLHISDKKARLKMKAVKPSVCELGTALAQLELIKINLLGRIAKLSKIKI